MRDKDPMTEPGAEGVGPSVRRVLIIGGAAVVLLAVAAGAGMAVASHAPDPTPTPTASTGRVFDLGSPTPNPAESPDPNDPNNQGARWQPDVVTAPDPCAGWGFTMRMDQSVGDARAEWLMRGMPPQCLPILPWQGSVEADGVRAARNYCVHWRSDPACTGVEVPTDDEFAKEGWQAWLDKKVPGRG